MRNARYKDVVNRSVHETLTRSIITGLTAIVPVLLLFIFGGSTLRDFAFALLIGLLSGGISSVLIAAPLAATPGERFGYSNAGFQLLAAIAEQAARLMHVSNYFYNEPNVRLGAELSRRTGMERVFFCNSGAEANEALFKLARRHFWAQGQKERYRFVAYGTPPMPCRGCHTLAGARDYIEYDRPTTMTTCDTSRGRPTPQQHRRLPAH